VAGRQLAAGVLYATAGKLYELASYHPLAGSLVYDLPQNSYENPPREGSAAGAIRGGILFTSFDIDDELFNEAWGLSSAKTKKALIEEVLKTYVRLHEQAGVRSLRGKLLWEGDLDEIRGERGAGSR
jgi:Arc/MetJ family transcription regulator